MRHNENSLLSYAIIDYICLVQYILSMLVVDAGYFIDTINQTSHFDALTILFLFNHAQHIKNVRQCFVKLLQSFTYRLCNVFHKNVFHSYNL